jgi:CRP/FNR family transcriptional activator FtrB
MSSSTIATEETRPELPSDNALLTALRTTPLFGDVADPVLRRLTAFTSIVSAAEDTELYRQGDPADRLFLVLEGQVAGVSECGTGDTAVVEVIRSGQTLGLATVLARLPRLMGIRTVTQCRFLVIEAGGLLSLVEQEPSLTTALLRAEATEFHSLVRQVCDLKLRTTAQRLGCYLLGLTTEKQINATAMRLPFDKRLLAARLGCRQENLSRAFATLRSVGVETHGARVILHDLAKLRAYSEPDEAIA